MKSRRVFGVVAGVALLAVAGALLYQAMSSSLVYFILPSDYANEPARYAERRLRLGGIVEEGTVRFNDESLMLSFQITDSLQSYPVSHYGTPPQLFKENTGVVVEGTFRDGVFSSDNLLVKHTEVYEPAEDGTISIDELRQTLQ
jgi:cytochrome c-type biogenesis protein CcmE